MSYSEGRKPPSYTFRSSAIRYRLVPSHATRRPSSHQAREIAIALDASEERILTRALLEKAPRYASEDHGLAGAVERGEVWVTRLHCGLVGGSRADLDEHDQEEEAVALVSLARDWIEIRLVDESGDPVPGAGYELRLPNGTVITGRLDAEGKLYVDDLPMGLCELTLTDETLPRRKPGRAINSA